MMETIGSLGENNILPRTAMVVGEAFIPGASELVVGNIGSGVVHLAGTTVAVAVLAPVAPLLAGLVALATRVNSYKRATTGVSLVESLTANARQQVSPAYAGVSGPVSKA